MGIRTCPHFCRVALAIFATAVAVPQLKAATATWTNLADGSMGYWTNSPNWNATFPGSSAGETAYLTNAVAASYTAILDRNISSLNSLILSNSNPGGLARLIVTNSALTNSGFIVGAGGQLQVDNGGLVAVTNAAPTSWLGNGGSLVLNSNGSLFTSVSAGIWYYGIGLGSTATVSATTSQGGKWNLGGNSLFIGGSVPSSNSVLAISGVTVTNVANIRVGSGTSSSGSAPSAGNSLVFSNGVTVLSPGSAVSVGVLTNDNNNSLLVGGAGAFSTVSLGGLTVGSGGVAMGNSMVITNALLTSGSTTIGGASSSSNSISVMAGGIWSPAGFNIRIGFGAGTTGSVMTVNGGAVSNVANLSVGYGAGSVGSRLDVLAGSLQVTNTLEVVPSAGSAGSLNLQGGTVWANILNVAGAGASAGSTGTVTVSGGLLLITNTLNVGTSGGAVGNLVVHGGAVSNVFTSQNNTVGGSGGTGNIFVDGGSVVFTNGLYFGGNGNLGYGSLTVTAGSFSVVNPGVNGYFMVANGSAGSVGNVTVGGSGSLAVSVGNGTGLVIGGNTGTTGSVLVTGGSMTLANPGSTIRIASGASSLGSLILSNGTVSLSNALTLASGTSSSGFYGQYNGTNSFIGSVTVGSGIGSTGTFTMAGGVLNLQNNLVASNSFVGTATQTLVNVNLAGGTIGSLGSWTMYGNANLTNAYGGNGVVRFAPDSGLTNTLSGVIAGNGTLVKDGAGLLVLASNNTYFGGTVVSNGVLQVGAGSGSGWVMGDITNYGALAFNRSDNVTFSNVISGTGGLLKLGAGTLIINSNTSTYSGGTVISNGAVQLGVGGTTGWLPGTISNYSLLSINRSDATALSNSSYAGTGSLQLGGGSSLSLVGNFTFASVTNTAGTIGISGGLVTSTNMVLTSSGLPTVLNIAGGTNLTGTLSLSATPGNTSVINVLTNGTLVVTNTAAGGNSSFLVGGGGGQAALNILGGSVWVSQLQANSTGTVLLAGGSLTVSNSLAFAYGSGSAATLLVSNGILSAPGFSLASNPGASGTAILAGGTNLFTATMSLGSAAGGTGMLLVASTTQTPYLILSNSNIRVAQSGFGQMVISNGVLNSTGSSAIQLGSTSTGAVGVVGIAGGTNSFTGGLSVANVTGSTGVFMMSGGQLNLSSGISTAGVGSVYLMGGSLGALASWASTANLTLTNQYTSPYGTLGTMSGPGVVTFAPTNAAHAITLSGIVSGNGKLVKDGAGSLTLNTNNSYIGGTIISNGAIIAGAAANTAFGTGKVTVVAGAILAASNGSPDTLLGVVDPTSAGVFALAASTASNLNFASRGFNNLFFGAYRGTYTNGGVFTPNGTTYQLGGGGGALVYTNPIAGTSNVLVGPVGDTLGGKVVLAAPNTMSGTVTLQSGVLQLNTNLAAGAASFVAAGGSLYLNTAAQNVTNGLVLNSDLGMGASASAGWIGPISGAGRLYLTNMAGGFLLSNNTYSGGTFLNSTPTMYVQGGNAFGVGTIVIGTNVASFTSTAAGIQTLTNYVQLAGSTLASSSPVFAGVIDLLGQTNAAMGYGGASGGTLISFLGAITNGYNVTFRNMGTATAAGGVLLGASNTWSGYTVVQGNSAIVTSNSGSIFGSTNFVIASGGTMILDNNRGSAFSRVDAGSQWLLSNGTLQIIGPGVAGQIFTQQVGAITVAAGANTLWTTNRGTFAMTDLFRPGGATLNLIGTNSTSMAISVGNTPAGYANGIIPWITVNGTDLAGWSGGQLGLYSGYLVNTTGLTVTNAPAGNWKLTNAVATTFGITDDTAINSLLIASNNVLLNLSNRTLTVGSGALLQPATGALTITNGTISFGSADGVLNASGTVTNFGSFSGASSFAKSGAAPLVLYGSNVFGGGFYVNQTNVTLAAGGSLTSGGALVVAPVSGAAFNLFGGTAIVGGVNVVSNALTIGTLALGSGSLTTTSNSTIQAAVTLGTAGPMTWNAIGGSNTVAGTLIVGSASGTQLNRLVVSNGAVMVSATGVEIGSLGGSFSNSVLVTGSGSVLSNASGSFLVGNGGSTNTLTIANGGAVYQVGSAYVGNNGSYNSALVTGAGSLWQMTAALNFSKTNNSLVVANGGAVIGTTNVLGGVGNTVAVAGPGSSLSGSGYIYVGASGGTDTGNALYVTNGGRVTLAHYILYGSNNLIYLSGPGTIMSNMAAANLYIGGSASAINNRVSILDGATNYVGGSSPILVGGGGGAASNVLEVAGSGSAFLMPGAAIQVGAASGSIANGLVITNGGMVLSSGGTISSVTGANSNWVLVAGSGSAWNAGTLTLGSLGAFNSLTISNGGMVLDTSATIGTSSNSILVDGSGSLWTNTAGVLLGNAGGFNRVDVTNAATVASVGLTLGTSATSLSNVVLVGSGSAWRSSVGAVAVGNSGSYNSLVITNGGVFVGTNTTAGFQAGSSNNTILVIGDGSMLTNVGNAVTIGNSGLLGRMDVLNGGSVFSVGLTLGSGGGSISNRVVVGSNSTWRSSAAVTVGNSGSYNLLLVTNGGVVVSTTGTIGSAAGSSNNVVIVSGAGSVWTNTSTSTFAVGNLQTSIGSSLSVLDGGAVFAGGQLSMNGSNGLVLVSGSNTLFSLVGSGSIILGNNAGSAGNMLVVSNGGRFLSPAGATIGNGAGGNSEMVLVTGNGSVWSNATGAIALTSGVAPSTNGFNQLVISDGGQVFVGGGGSLTAGSANSTNDTIFVTGGGLVDLSGSLVAGSAGAGNWISNSGGVYQFTTNTPVITPGVYGRIAINNGTIAFRGITNADVRGSLGSNQVGNILFAGNNTFRLNNASNWSATAQDYTFNGGISPSNYVGLEMINGGTAWKSAWLNIGSGGTMLVSNTAATVFGTVSNSGSITIANASATFWSNVVLNSGSLYRAFAGTNAFNAGLTINSGATMTMDAWSTLTGGVTNNSLLQILTNAVYALTGGQLPAGSGALNITWGGALSFSNGTFNGFGGGGVTNNGLADIQNLGVLSLGGSAATPAGSGVLRVNSGGVLNFTTGNFTVANTVSNLGTVNLSNAVVTFGAPVVIGGMYSSDPSTNIFTTNVMVTVTGALQGSNGDLFVFQKDLFMQSTNATQFNLWQSAVLFSNGPNHLLSLSNSAAMNVGGVSNFSMVAQNFAIGQLSIALGDKLTITGNRDSRTNALYVGWFDIQGLGTGSLLTNSYLAVSNTLVSLFNLPDISLYYDKFDPRNDWLNEWMPDLGYELWGAGNGLLLPIPEPSTWVALGGGLLCLGFLRRRKVK